MTEQDLNTYTPETVDRIAEFRTNLTHARLVNQIRHNNDPFTVLQMQKDGQPVCNFRFSTNELQWGIFKAGWELYRELERLGLKDVADQMLKEIRDGAGG